MGFPSEGLSEMSYRNSWVGKGLSGTAGVNWYLEEGARVCQRHGMVSGTESVVGGFLETGG